MPDRRTDEPVAGHAGIGTAKTVGESPRRGLGFSATAIDWCKSNGTPLYVGIGSIAEFALNCRSGTALPISLPGAVMMTGGVALGIQYGSPLRRQGSSRRRFHVAMILVTLCVLWTACALSNARP